MERTSDESLKLLTEAVWKAYGNEGDCPPGKYLEFRQLDDLISTTAWGDEARNEFFQRWTIVEKTANKRFEVGSFAELAHLAWEEAAKIDEDIKHPLAPLIHAWHSGPSEVLPVRNADGHLRGDTIVPRIAMRESGNSGTDRLYLPPTHQSRCRRLSDCAPRLRGRQWHRTHPSSTRRTV